MGLLLKFIFAFVFFFTILVILWYPLRAHVLKWFARNPTNKHDSHEETLPSKDLVERYPSQEEIDLQKDLEEERVVGMVEPVGFWTKKILAEKLQVLMAKFGDEHAKAGYWQRLVLKQRREPQAPMRNPSHSKTRR